MAAYMEMANTQLNVHGMFMENDRDREHSEKHRNVFRSINWF